MARRIDISLPTGWGELSEEQLRFLFNAMLSVDRSTRNISFLSREDYIEQSAAQVRLLCFLDWSGIEPVCPYGSGFLLRRNGLEFELSFEVLADAASRLSWISELPQEPVRISRVDGAEAVPADIASGFSFDSWLSCETLWQAYQSAQDDGLLVIMAEILYRKPGIRPDPAETLGVFYWWAGVKNMVSAMFPNFFKLADSSGESSEGPDYDSMRRNMDSQIRALTKGDITKEKEVLALDAIRALTELDAQAREYDELNRKYPSK